MTFSRICTLLFLLIALLTLTSAANAEGRERWSGFWGTWDEELFRQRAQHLLARNPRSVEGLNMAGMAHMASRSQADIDLAVAYFLTSWTARPNRTAALALSQLALIKSNREESAALWALRAMEFPKPSLTALALFERAVARNSTLSKLENAKVRQLRAHRQRWIEYRATRTKPFAFSQVGLQESQRLPADEERTFKFSGSQLVARSKEGIELWKRPLESQQAKLIATGPRLFIISPEWVQVLDAKNGALLSKWSSLVSTNIDSAVLAGNPATKITWNVWVNPDALLGADDKNLWVGLESWMMVLRQSDAGGWAHYWTHWFQAVPSEDETMLVSHYGWYVAALAKQTGKPIWSYGPEWEGTITILEVNRNEVVVYSPQVEKLLGLSRKTGKILWSETHTDRP